MNDAQSLSIHVTVPQVLNRGRALQYLCDRWAVETTLHTKRPRVDRERLVLGFRELYKERPVEQVWHLLKPKEKHLLHKSIGAWDEMEVWYGSWCTEMLGEFLWALQLLTASPHWDEVFNFDQMMEIPLGELALQEPNRIAFRPDWEVARRHNLYQGYALRASPEFEEDDENGYWMPGERLHELVWEMKAKKLVPPTRHRDLVAFGRPFKKLGLVNKTTLLFYSKARLFALNWLLGIDPEAEESLHRLEWP